MVTQTVEFAAPTGMTLTAKVSLRGSDTIAASVSATEATYRKGVYTAAFTDVAAGSYLLTTADGACVWGVDLLLVTDTYYAYELGQPNLMASAKTMAQCTVGAGSTTTSIVTSACSPAGAVADQFKFRIACFHWDTATAALRGQLREITASTSAAAPTLTVAALTTAPASGDKFTIL